VLLNLVILCCSLCLYRDWSISILISTYYFDVEWGLSFLCVVFCGVYLCVCVFVCGVCVCVRCVCVWCVCICVFVCGV
jgi:hypothetical protein